MRPAPFKLPIISSVWHAEDVKTICLERPEAFEYEAGQECLVSLGDGQFPKERRPMSIASHPSQSDFIELTIKAYGPFTHALCASEPGDHLIIQGPLGKTFKYSRHCNTDLVFLAAGTGLVPFISLLREFNHNESGREYLLINSNKSAENILYRQVLEDLQAQMKALRVCHTLTQTVSEGWDGYRGRINAELIKSLIPDMREKRYLICGPAAMVLEMKESLLELGLEESSIFFDPWGIQIEKKMDKKSNEVNR